MKLSPIMLTCNHSPYTGCWGVLISFYIRPGSRDAARFSSITFRFALSNFRLAFSVSSLGNILGQGFQSFGDGPGCFENPRYHPHGPASPLRDTSTTTTLSCGSSSSAFLLHDVVGVVFWASFSCFMSF